MEKGSDSFIKAYHEFKEEIDFSLKGNLPELESLVWALLMGVPSVPADHDSREEASFEAVDQRIAILKAVFIEVNRGCEESFLDQGLGIYDRAGKQAKRLLEEGKADC